MTDDVNPMASAQLWHEGTCPPEEGTCYCCCWDCPDNNPHFREAMQFPNNGVMDQG